MFISDPIFKKFEEIFLNELSKNNCDAYVYLFMPDHFHTLIGGKNEKANAKICMDKFKQKTGFWLTKNMNGFQWQKDYYDHILRTEESLEIKTKYILMNPVRKNIVNYWKNYKYKGSTVYKLDDWD